MTAQPYEHVASLFFSWEDADAVFEEQLNELKVLLHDIYNYPVEQYRIPSERPHKALREMLSSFIKKNDGEGHLIIIYYGGHASMNERDNEDLLLTP